MSESLMKFVPLFEFSAASDAAAKPVSFAFLHYLTERPVYRTVLLPGCAGTIRERIPSELRKTGESELHPLYGRQIEITRIEVAKVGAELTIYEDRIEFDPTMLALLMRKYEEKMVR